MERNYGFLEGAICTYQIQVRLNLLQDRYPHLKEDKNLKEAESLLKKLFDSIADWQRDRNKEESEQWRREMELLKKESQNLEVIWRVSLN